jgi:protocatechuate 3,4-dioxygenase, beta subunit
MKNIFGLVLLLLITSSCSGQSGANAERQVGGPCEDCEAALDYGILKISPSAIDTLPGFLEYNPKISISGTVFNRDGKTPAENIILYVYHTSRNGVYEPSKNPIGWEKRHGQFRGWIKTGEDGRFTFYTFRPAPYPAVGEPEHIHIYVKEPNTIPYYIDSYLFMDDPTLTKDKVQAEENRGGSGVIKLEKQNGILAANRDIILGLNIPDY